MEFFCSDSLLLKTLQVSTIATNTNTMITSTNTLPTLAPTMTGILGGSTGGALVPLTERDQNSFRYII